MRPVTSHILDLSSGRPAKGVAVTLSFQVNDGWDVLDSGVTDDDGRVVDLLLDGVPPAGIYRFRFDTYAYFLKQGVRALHPSIAVNFSVDDPSGHHHVPLLLGPFGYSTYRGSWVEALV